MAESFLLFHQLKALNLSKYLNQ